MNSNLPYGPVNVALFQEVKRKILEEPLRFDMGEWGRRVPQNALWTYTVGDGFIQDRPPCGTVACIAGWASATNHIARGGALQDWHLMHHNVLQEATELLGVSPEFVDNIFFVFGWPDSFRWRYCDATTKAEQAKVAADYIDWICGLYQGES